MTFDIIVACTEKGVIGKNGKIPWFDRNDLSFVYKLTTFSNKNSNFNSIIFGRKTWESLPVKPLTNRYNIIVSKTLQTIDHKDTFICDSFKEALNLAKELKSPKVFCLGGSEIYNEALKENSLKYIFVTNVKNEYDGDTFFPIEKVKRFEKINFSFFGEEINIYKKTLNK